MTIHTFKPIVFTLSLVSLLGLLTVNLALLAGRPAPFEVSFLQLFALVFPIWAFTIYYLNKTTPPLSDQSAREMGAYRVIWYYLGGMPDWARYMLVGIYLYALYSLFLFVTGGMADPDLVNGQYQINNHGNVTTYTEAEYQALHNQHLRAITGFFLAFFAVSTAVLAPWPVRGDDR
ncbi:MAG: hypothetical protein EP344_04275 [Bacteroidetes bacterium]|nr:MAG: hypothetical protein EP344_04275 [Bacteroidota bacterium]